jgi:signal transduction histidine kinase
VGSTIQALSHRLHSSKLHLLGLPAAAAAFCREFAGQHNLTVNFTHDGVPEQLSQEIKIGLFRVMQEALMNAAKYSGVRQFDVALSAKGDSLQLDVVDHGVGFEPDSSLERPGLGLVSMQERLSLIGGQLLVLSKPGEGTTIRACVRNVQPKPEAIRSIVDECGSVSNNIAAVV